MKRRDFFKCILKNTINLGELEVQTQQWNGQSYRLRDSAEKVAPILFYDNTINSLESILPLIGSQFTVYETTQPLRQKNGFFSCINIEQQNKLYHITGYLPESETLELVQKQVLFLTPELALPDADILADWPATLFVCSEEHIQTLTNLPQPLPAQHDVFVFNAASLNTANSPLWQRAVAFLSDVN